MRRHKKRNVQIWRFSNHPINTHNGQDIAVCLHSLSNGLAKNEKNKHSESIAWQYKSPTGCMYSWRYNILSEVKEGIWSSFKIKKMCRSFVCIAFKDAGNWLTCQKLAQYLQGYRKKSGKLFHLWNLLSERCVILRKISEVQWKSKLIWKSRQLTYMPKIRSISASV